MTVYYGVNRSATGEMYYYLDDHAKKFAVRFTARETKVVSKLHIYTEQAKSPPIFRAGLQGDNNGIPSGEWLACGEFTPKDNDDNIIDLNVEIEQSKTYFIVLEYVSGVIDSTHYALPHVDTQKPHHYLYPPCLLEANYLLLRSTDGGSSWSKEDGDFGWVLEFSDGTYYGQPYIEPICREFYGNLWRAERIKPSCRITLGSLEVFIRKIGNPPTNLDVLVHNITDNITELSVTIPSSAVPSTPSWVKLDFPSPLTLLPSKTYRFILKTDGGDLSNCYAMYTDMSAPLLSYATWGGKESFWEPSDDGGNTWDDSNRGVDMLIRFSVITNTAVKTAPNGGI